MSVMAKYVRIFWPEPKDEDVARRNNAVISVQAWMSGRSDPWESIVLASALASAVEDGLAHDAFAPTVERAILDAGSAGFVRDGHDTEMIVVALVAALDLMQRPIAADVGWISVDALAAGLWSALSFQTTVGQEPLEVLRQSVITAARKRTMAIAEASRARSHVPEIGSLTLPEAQPTGGRANAAYRRATEPLVKALRENAELDREELEFLWWSIEDWSEPLGQRISDLPTLARAVVGGLSGAAKLRRLPAVGHRNVVLKGIPVGEPADLASVVVALGEHRVVLAEDLGATRVDEATAVFPLLRAVLGETTERSGSGLSRDARDWGSRALLERGILEVATRRES